MTSPQEGRRKLLEREILPPDLREHLINARGRGYAGDGKYIGDDVFPGFKRFMYEDEERGYYYEDRFRTAERRPGNFSGLELLSRYSKGAHLVVYTYAGGLTEQGLETGEEKVYGRLQRFLKEHIEETRLGKPAEYSFEDESGKWKYVAFGEIVDWGWKDRETITLNGIILYDFSGQGACFLPDY